MLDEDLIKKINKIISNMVLTIASAVAEVEQMYIFLSQADSKTLLTIKISNENKPLSRSLIDKLTKKSAINLDTQNINIYLACLLLEHYDTEVHCVCENNSLEISIAIT